MAEENPSDFEAELAAAREEFLQRDAEIEQSKKDLNRVKRKPIPRPPKREPLPVAERPIAPTRRSRHHRKDSVSDLPSHEDLGHYPELELNNFNFNFNNISLNPVAEAPAKQAPPPLPKQEPLVVAQPTPSRRSRHNRNASVVELPSHEELGHYPELEFNNFNFGNLSNPLTPVTEQTAKRELLPAVQSTPTRRSRHTRNASVTDLPSHEELRHYPELDFNNFNFGNLQSSNNTVTQVPEQPVTQRTPSLYSRQNRTASVIDAELRHSSALDLNNFQFGNADPQAPEQPVAQPAPSRRSSHNRSSSVIDLPDHEELRHYPELDFHNFQFGNTLRRVPDKTAESTVEPPRSPPFTLSVERISGTSLGGTPITRPSTPKASSRARSNPLFGAPINNNRKMSYQNFVDPNQGGQPSNPRQPPPSPGQNMAHVNGMNGQMGMGGMPGMIGYPTPAGHQSDLNFIMHMVEDLSRLLADNRKLTEGIVEKVGNVRMRAKDQNLSNEELLALVSEELNSSSENLEKENSQLHKDLQFAKADAEENWKLVLHAASILDDIKEKAHNYKYQHEKDTLAWHKSYREQLAAERKENLELRCHISDMQAHAAKANGYLNQLRRYTSEHQIITELTTQVHQYKSERNFWKRMACPGLIDDPSEWSDDEGGATGDIPEEQKIKYAEHIKKREEMAEIIRGGMGPPKN